ncbi:MAG: 3'-5' exonuclease, partial [Candidatus Andersenbacteria bacterium]|nr:3'-5' exonuclease [Candidatus Andersenbacteria bacterium]
MYLFFDTETTGLPKRWDAPVSDLDNWPRLVQIAWVYYNGNGKEIFSKSVIIKPEGFDIPADSAKIHGITTEIAKKKGEALNKILSEFLDAMNKSKFLIAHNMSFDEKIIEAEFLRKEIPTSL